MSTLNDDDYNLPPLSFRNKIASLEHHQQALCLFEYLNRAAARNAELIAGKEALIADKDALMAGKEALIADKDALIAGKEALIAEKDS